MGPIAFLFFLLLLFGFASKDGGKLVPKKVKLPDTLDGDDKIGSIAKPKPLPGAPDLKLTVSADCKTVTVGSKWWDDVATPDAVALIENGVGLPIYTAEQADRSLDAAIRTVVAKSAGESCIQEAPWLDRWVKAHPLPKPKPEETRDDYLKRLEAWDDTWDATISGWAGTHPQLFDLFKKLGALIYVRWALSRNVDPGYQGLMGPLPAGVSMSEAKALRNLGYNAGPIVVDEFQTDYNLVQNYRTNFEWSINKMDIEMDNIVGPQTREALKQALIMDTVYGGWPVVLEAARIG